jgi:hypothetical protein
VTAPTQPDPSSAALRMAVQPTLATLDELLAAIRALQFQSDHEIDRLLKQNKELLAALRVTAGNIRSLGPAGGLDAIPDSYRIWLQVVEDAIATATTRTDADVEDDHRAIREESEAYE